MDRDHVDALLTQWEEQRPEMDTRALAVAARIVRLERYLGRAAGEVVARWGVNEGELNVLAALRRAGEPFALTPTELYQGLLLSSGAMTNRIDRLEEQGYVERHRDERDRRRVLVVLTDAGRHLIEEAMDQHVATLADSLAVLDDDERQALEALLRKVLASLESDGG